MKTLLIVTLLAALAVIALCYDPFINRRKANNFMSPQQRWRAKFQERTRERTKPTHEIQREACDDYTLCSRYAYIHGYNAAYNRYFRQQRNN